MSQSILRNAQRAALRFASRFPTPLGQMRVVLDGGGSVVQLEFCRRANEPSGDDRAESGPCREVRRQLEEYFHGKRRSFDLRLAPQGTLFQAAVWKELLGIPFGERVTYRELAARIGRPAASRAVGGANGANPIAVVIPCHRVVGSDGSLTGYGAGVSIKRWLLDLESEVRRSRL